MIGTEFDEAIAATRNGSQRSCLARGSEQIGAIKREKRKKVPF